MTHQEAIDLIAPGIPAEASTWADMGAGTGVFTLALQEILPSGTIYAADKSPHMLWRLPSTPNVKIEVLEADFTRPFEMPQVEGILMANALHYAKDPIQALTLVLAHLAPGGTFMLIEYDTDQANPPWVPYPISAPTFQQIAPLLGLTTLRDINRRTSIYQEEIYVVTGKKASS